MRVQIPPYPQIDPSVILEKHPEFKFSYSNNDITENLDATFWKDSSFIFESKLWNPADFNLNLEETVSLKDLNSVFYGTNAVASPDSTIGIALRWQLPDLGIRGFVPLGEFHSDSISDSFNVTYSFSPRQIRKRLILETILFLADPQNTENSYFATAKGAVLSVLDTRTLYTSGGGSGKFPTLIYSGSDHDPLWQLECDLEDIGEPFNEETFALKLNQNNPAYEQVFVSGEKVSPLLFEIFSNSCFNLIYKVISNSDFDLESTVFSETSIAGYVKTFCKNYLVEYSLKDLKNQDVLELMTTVRKKLTEQIKICKKDL